ncbi:uncharacterized protein At1g66480-like isoform X2 [Phalaenopsis equestris]|uniref:uncharacterized protein At1g66480-like isoform X2 n=1 Tax=Phalaenopsis equestris TaxID=78828 RepID=UPI0009E1CAD4|nr:uncharacterized protein At1g66480-like isoform X2 [Phalaenopsis equestris]
MGNSLGIRKKKTAKVMKIDGTTFRLKPPLSAGDVLKNHPGFSVLDADEVKTLGVRARPLANGDPIRAGHLYFLVHPPPLPADNNPRRAYSGNLRVSAKDRLESLLLSRRAVSDLAMHHRPAAEAAAVAVAEKSPDGSMRLRMRLPKAEVARLLEESKDAGEITRKIVELAASVRSTQGPPTPGVARKKRTRFMEMPAEIIA